MVKKLFILSLLLAPLALMAETQVTVLSAPKVLQQAKQLPSSGELKLQGHYAYLSASNQFINKLYPLLMQKLKNKRCVVKSRDQVGAHITLLSKGYLAFDEWKKLKAMAGQQFNFRPISVAMIVFSEAHNNRTYQEKYYVVRVRVPGLRSALDNQGLEENVTRHIFHVTIAEAKTVNGLCR